MVQKATGSYRTYSFLVKLKPGFLSFAVEDLPLNRTAALVPEFAVKDLGQNTLKVLSFHSLLYSIIITDTCGSFLFFLLLYS